MIDTRNASPQAWARLRKHTTDSERRDIARDIAAVINDDVTQGVDLLAAIEYALSFKPWDSKRQA